MLYGYTNSPECSPNAPTNPKLAMVKNPALLCYNGAKGWSTAGLLRNVAVPFTIDATYTSSNRTIEDEAWRSPDLVPDTGLVALSDDWVRSMSLPKAQRFPWDDSKGIYLLNGFHNLHCLVSFEALISSSSY